MKIILIIFTTQVLAQEYYCDAFSKTEVTRLLWIAFNQIQLRAEPYQIIYHYINFKIVNIGKISVIPPTFIGNPGTIKILCQDTTTIV